MQIIPIDILSSCNFHFSTPKVISTDFNNPRDLDFRYSIDFKISFGRSIMGHINSVSTTRLNFMFRVTNFGRKPLTITDLTAIGILSFQLSCCIYFNPIINHTIVPILNMVTVLLAIIIIIVMELFTMVTDAGPNFLWRHLRGL